MTPKEDIFPRPDPQSGLGRGLEHLEEIKKQGGGKSGRCRSAGQQQLLEKLRSKEIMKMKPDDQSAEGPGNVKKMKVAVQDVGIGRRRPIQAAAAGKFDFCCWLVEIDLAAIKSPVVANSRNLLGFKIFFLRW